jgi:predicted RNA-binding protein with PUA-like domain
MSSAPSHWLMKTEPDVFGIDHLAERRVEHWDGVRNLMARNNIRSMKVGDRVLFYHSSADPPGVAGLARVCRAAYPDFTAWDPTSDYYDPRSSPDAPRWFMVDVEFEEKFPRLVSLEELRANRSLKAMVAVRPIGMRLSVQPVTRKQFEIICQLGRAPVTPEPPRPRRPAPRARPR